MPDQPPSEGLFTLVIGFDAKQQVVKLDFDPQEITNWTLILGMLEMAKVEATGLAAMARANHLRQQMMQAQAQQIQTAQVDEALRKLRGAC